MRRAATWATLSISVWFAQGCWWFCIVLALWALGYRLTEGPGPDDDMFSDEALARWLDA